MTLLEFVGVSKQFGGLRAVDDVTFNVNAGEIVGLIGPNGAGKTTLFSMASGFIVPTSGEIRFNGQRISGRSPAEVCRRGLVRTFQVVRPFGDMTVLENVMIGAFLHTPDPAKAREKAMELLRWLGMEGRAAQPARTLTLAGRKRLEVAKALATEPKCLLLDEVMAGLTPAETDGMIELILAVRDRGVTVLVVEHNLRAVMKLCDRVVVLQFGRKIADGTPHAVAKDPTVIRAYIGEDGD